MFQRFNFIMILNSNWVELSGSMNVMAQGLSIACTALLQNRDPVRAKTVAFISIALLNEKSPATKSRA
jgi:hypothetical protein